MSSRDELARDIFLADNSNAAEGVAEKDWDDNREHHDYAYEIADRLIPKGYSKPRTIETVEELDALEDPEVILMDYCGHPYQWGISIGGSEGWMAPHDQTPITSRHLWRFSPITVLNEPAP